MDMVLVVVHQGNVKKITGQASLLTVHDNMVSIHLINMI